jgi:hypothetical protein
MIVGSPIPEEPLMPDLVSFSWPPTKCGLCTENPIPYVKLKKGILLPVHILV